MKRLAARVREARQARGWSQAVLASKAGITREFLARIETAVQVPSLPMLEAIARVLDVDVVDLVTPSASTAARRPRTVRRRRPTKEE